METYTLTLTSDDLEVLEEVLDNKIQREGRRELRGGSRVATSVVDADEIHSGDRLGKVEGK